MHYHPRVRAIPRGLSSSGISQKNAGKLRQIDSYRPSESDAVVIRAPVRQDNRIIRRVYDDCRIREPAALPVRRGQRLQHLIAPTIPDFSVKRLRNQGQIPLSLLSCETRVAAAAPVHSAAATDLCFQNRPHQSRISRTQSNNSRKQSEINRKLSKTNRESPFKLLAKATPIEAVPMLQCLPGSLPPA